MGNGNKKPKDKGQAPKDPAKDPKYKAMVAAAAKRRAEEPHQTAPSQPHGGPIARYNKGRIFHGKGGKRRTRRKRRRTRTHKRRRHRRSHKRRRRHKRRHKRRTRR